MMTFTEMMEFVRLQADADEVDAPQTTLTVHARMAYNDILSRKVAWDHLEVHYDLATVADTQEYAFPTSGTDTIERVYSITTTSGLTKRLMYVTRSDADLLYDNDGTRGEPEAYTLYNGKIVLYPVPGAVYNLKVHGFREPHSWPAEAGSIPDLPDPFHDCIAWYMLSSFYMGQEDTQLAGAYLTEYQQMVARCMDGVSVRNARPRPKTLGGQHGRSRSFLDRVKGMVEG